MAHQHIFVRRGRTADRGPPPHPEQQSPAPGSGPPLSHDATILTLEQIGPKREITAQGYLLCRDVPMARTGDMMYGVGEVPVKPALGVPFLRVVRGPEELFSPEAMGSFIGAPVTHEHPPVDVTPENWQQLAKGYILAVRRGEGEDSDCLMGDLLITDKWLIGEINAGKREVSLGYDAGYKTLAPGFGQQFNIIGNHIALVERGRCGPRCAIGDSDVDSSDPHHQLHEETMGTKTRKTLDELNDDKARIEAEIEARQRTGDADEGGIHIHVHTADKATAKAPGDEEEEKEGTAPAKTLDKAVEERFKTIETAQAEQGSTLKEILAAVKGGGAINQEIEDEEGRGRTGDSAALERGFTEFVSQAEILVPGFRVPTFDSALPRKHTVDSMCAGRRSVLTAAYATAEGKKLIDGITGRSELALDKASCSDVAITFRAAASTKAAMNNRAATGDSRSVPQGGGTEAKPHKAPTLAEINAANEKYWAEVAKRGQA